MRSKIILLCISLLIFSVALHGQENNNGTPPNPPQAFTYVEQMPTAPYDYNEYLSKNIRYPDSAISKNIGGKVIVKFVVNEDGAISDCSVVRGVGGGLDEEALRVVRSFPPWKPGKQNGKPVKVFFTLPIVFKLSDDLPSKDSANNDKPIIAPDQMPFAEYNYNEYLSENIHYPENARVMGVQGRVIVSFVVNKDGHISDCKVLKSVAPDVDSEAVRVVRSFPPWRPGKRNGKLVKVFFTLPIVFKLSNDELDRKVDVSHVTVERVAGRPFPNYDISYYLSANLSYPFKARKKGIQGEVVIAFVVNEDGSISDCYVEKGIGGGCDEEALRVIKNMPAWTPNSAQPVKIHTSLPLVFKLRVGQ